MKSLGMYKSLEIASRTMLLVLGKNIVEQVLVAGDRGVTTFICSVFWPGGLVCQFTLDGIQVKATQ